MIIIFKSKIKNKENVQNIEFKSNVTISKMNEFKVFEFLEPKNKIMNRIEVSKNKVNIFAGPSTINLSLNEIINNEYEVENNLFIFESELLELNIQEKEINFSYKLKQKKLLIGVFNIILKIEENL